MSSFIHLIADYGRGDPAFSEVIHRLKYEDPKIDVQPTSVSKFSTTETGFWIEQLSVNNPPFESLLIYSNTAPRIEDKSPRHKNEGENLCYALLYNSVPVIAVNTGYNFSFIKEHIDEFYKINVSTQGSQFRSRDFFPEKVVKIASGNLKPLGKEKSISSIPEIPENTVCYIDGYGNIKTSIRSSEFNTKKEKIKIQIGGIKKEVRVRDNVFNVKEKECVIAPGSNGGDDPYMEIFLRGGSASKKFQNPKSGEDIKFIKF